MTNVSKIKKGEKFVCLHAHMSEPTVGTVIALTSDPGKMIGLEFEKDVGIHSCDGRGKNKYCIWVRPENILTEEEYAQLLKVKETTSKTISADLDEIVLRT